MMTLALFMILEGFTVALWGADLRRYPSLFVDNAFMAGPIVIPKDMLTTFLASVCLMIAFLFFFQFSRLGARMRAVADDQVAAQATGIGVRQIFEISWGFGNLIAALGGVALGMITMLSPGLSFYGMKVLPVVILGGLESVTGAIVGGIIIGLIEGLAGGYLEMSLTGAQEVTPFILLFFFMLFKPHGLFGQKKIERI
jgi:branched-chain amino acid transport system permease protein